MTESIIKINGEFLCEGNRRSKEYPDAQVFTGTGDKSATATAFRFQRSYQAIRKYRKSDPPYIIQVFSNYGMENQHLDLELEA